MRSICYTAAPSIKQRLTNQQRPSRVRHRNNMSIGKAIAGLLAAGLAMAQTPVRQPGQLNPPGQITQPGQIASPGQLSPPASAPSSGQPISTAAPKSPEAQEPAADIVVNYQFVMAPVIV